LCGDGVVGGGEMHRGEFAGATCGDGAVHEDDDVLVLVVLKPACAAEGRVRLYIKVREIKEIHARSLS
jgi:hypothetical protein